MTRKEGESGGAHGDKKEIVEEKERNKEEKEHIKEIWINGDW